MSGFPRQDGEDAIRSEPETVEFAASCGLLTCRREYRRPRPAHSSPGSQGIGGTRREHAHESGARAHLEAALSQWNLPGTLAGMRT